MAHINHVSGVGRNRGISMLHIIDESFVILFLFSESQCNGGYKNFMPFQLPDPTTPFGQRVAKRLHEEPIIWLTTIDSKGTPQPAPVCAFGLPKWPTTDENMSRFFSCGECVQVSGPVCFHAHCATQRYEVRCLQAKSPHLNEQRSFENGDACSPASSRLRAGQGRWDPAASRVS